MDVHHEGDGMGTFFWKMFGIIKERGVYLELLKCGQTANDLFT